MNQLAELKAKLLAMYSPWGDGIPTQYVNPDGPEAATAITDLEARDMAADFRYISDGFVAEGFACLGDRPRIPLGMAHAGVGDFDQQLVVANFRNGNVDDLALAWSNHNNLFHASSL